VLIDWTITPIDPDKLFVYLSSSKKQIGPIFIEQLLEMLEKGVIEDDDFLWVKENKWQKFSKVKRLLCESIPAITENEISMSLPPPPPFIPQKQQSAGDYQQKSFEPPPFSQSLHSQISTDLGPNSIPEQSNPPSLMITKPSPVGFHTSISDQPFTNITPAYVKEKILNENASLIAGVLSMVFSLYALLTIFSLFPIANLSNPVYDLAHEINSGAFFVIGVFCSLCSFIGWFLGFIGLLLAHSTRIIATKYSVAKSGIALKGIFLSIIGLSTSIWCSIWISTTFSLVFQQAIFYITLVLFVVIGITWLIIELLDK
jgi:hypothetical protein